MCGKYVKKIECVLCCALKFEQLCKIVLALRRKPFSTIYTLRAQLKWDFVRGRVMLVFGSLNV